MPRFLGIALLILLSAAPAAARENSQQPDASAVVVRVIDGDSLLVDIPAFPPVVGRRIGIRVAGCDTSELSDPDPEVKRSALTAKALVERVAPPGSTVILRNIRRDKYFRLLCDVETQQGDLAALLISSHLALPFDGGKKPLHTAGVPRNRDTPASAAAPGLPPPVTDPTEPRPEPEQPGHMQAHPQGAAASLQIARDATAQQGIGKKPVAPFIPQIARPCPAVPPAALLVKEIMLVTAGGKSQGAAFSDPTQVLVPPACQSVHTAGASVGAHWNTSGN